TPTTKPSAQAVLWWAAESGGNRSRASWPRVGFTSVNTATPTSTTRIAGRRTCSGRNAASIAPATAPTSARPAAGNVADRSGLTRLRYVTEETVVPAIDPTLLVASACTALIPGT